MGNYFKALKGRTK